MKVVTLEDIAEVSAGQGAPQGDHNYGDEGLPFIKAGNLENLIITNDEYKSCKLVSSDTAKQYKLKSYPKDTLVFAKSGMSATKGRIYRLNSEAYVVNHLSTIIPNTKFVDPKYLRYFFYVFSPSRLIKDESYPSIGLADIKKIKIPLPPLEDQKRIIKILDKADTLRQKRKQSTGLLDDYLKSVFLEMFGDPVQNPKGWRIEKLEKITNKVTDGTHKTPQYKTSGVKFISAKNIKEEAITWDDIKYISEEEHREIYKRCNPERNDLLLTKSGSLGMVALVDVDFEFSLFESLALLKINQELADPIFLREYLNLKEIKSFYSQRTKGVGVKHLHLVDIKSLPIILPPKKDQQKFVQKVRSIKALKQKMLAQSKELEMQFQALMQKAFKGAL
jgi:type I restriction enzyme S subunit